MDKLHASLDSLIAQPIPLLSQNAQSRHRLEILKSWLDLASEYGYNLGSQIVGQRTLDVGCGQGDMTQAFAAMLHRQGNKDSRVIGVDPGNSNYGSPLTLGEAQAKLTSSPLGSYLAFKRSTADALLADNASKCAVAYLAHSLYYFESPATVFETFKTLRKAGVQTLMLAEWSLTMTRSSALPHLLSVLLQSMDPVHNANVRTVLSPNAYVDLAFKAGWRLVGSMVFAPSKQLEDGEWEMEFSREVVNRSRQNQDTLFTSNPSDLVYQTSLRAHADALEASVDNQTRVSPITSMDVWTAVFTSNDK